MSGPSLFSLHETISLLDGMLNDIEERRAETESSAKLEGRPFDPSSFEAEQEALIMEAITSAKTQGIVKIDNLCAYIAELSVTSQARSDEAKRLTSLASSGQKRAERIKSRLKWFMEEEGLAKLETPRYKLGIQANGGRAPIVYSDPNDPGKLLPDSFVRIVREPLADLVYADLQAGATVPGASLGERGTHLRIR